MNRWLGTLNHVSITVSDLDAAMAFFEPWLDFLGYTYHERGENSGTRVSINLNPATNIAFNIWEAKGDLAKHPFEVYEPGLHHMAFNADTHERVDEMAELVTRLGGTILDGPAEFPFGIGGYYAVYFLGPDNLKFEFVHMPALEAFYE
ncbi:MAG: VOC family protein [Maricaulaceae bacterium]|jgi:catechol 2,3-dioxygenase-like lactoylglutathione lyase family enzyme